MAKVLHVTIQGILGGSDPDQALVATSLKVMQSGQPGIGDGPDITVNLKDGEAYREPADLNADVIEQVEDFINAQYSVSGFDKVYLLGGFSALT